MRQIYITGHGGPEKLQVRESPDPQPQGSELRIRVKASGINCADILARQGLYPDATKVPCVVGYEVSGSVDAVGPAARQDWVGRDAFALTRFGDYADPVVVPETQVFGKPASLSHEECAAVPVNYLTVWQLLVVMGSLSADETVLIHNAGGGVGLAAIDVARHIGARIFGTASAGKHAFLKERGLNEAIDYRGKDWSTELSRLTDGRGVELIIDPIGGNHWKKSYKALRSTGRLGVFGVSAASDSGKLASLKLLRTALGTPFFHPLSFMNKNRGVFGVNMGHLWHEPDKIRSSADKLLQGVAAGWVRPHVEKAFSFDHVGEAHAYLEARKNIGKVVLTP